MARPDKAAAVAEMTEDFRNAQATVLTEYRGLTVAAMKQLRRALGEQNKYSVVKNTLTKIAAREAGIPVPEELLVGPSAVAFINGDPVVAAKSLKDFAKTNPLLVIKGGVLDGKFLTATEIGKMADLESREVLLSKMAGAIKAAFAQAIRSIDALRIKLEALETAAAPTVEQTPPTVEETPPVTTPTSQEVSEVMEAPAVAQATEVMEAPESTEESKG